VFSRLKSDLQMIWFGFYRYSAKVVFNTKYVIEKEVEEASKSQLIESIQNVSQGLEEFPSFQEVLANLITIAKDPWCNEIMIVSNTEDATSLTPCGKIIVIL